MRNLRSLLIALTLACVSLSGNPALAQGTTRSLNDDLLYRITFGRVDDIVILLDRGAETNIYGPTGETPLILAVNRKSEEAEAIIKALLAKGADPNFADRSGTYPLEGAIREGKANLIKTFIEAGADIHLKSVKGEAMADLALQKNQQDITDIINARLKKEAEIEAQMHSPERLLTLVQQFSAKVCEYTYWSNYLSSGQNPKDDDSSRTKITKTKDLGEKLGSDIARNFPKIDVNSFMQYSSESISNVYKSYPDNKARADEGFGTDQDALKRCSPIADALRDTVSKALAPQAGADNKSAAAAPAAR